MANGNDACILQLLGRERDEAVNLLHGVFAAGRVRLADRAIAFSGVRKSIQSDADAYEPAMRVLIPPIGLHPLPRLVDRILETKE
ncbi:MAG: hypothetical protein KJN97_00565 [Deltaproteobacteria bacterium]|nr:hypothetical protein [Deltaproteobacteria bacterium]